MLSLIEKNVLFLLLAIFVTKSISQQYGEEPDYNFAANENQKRDETLEIISSRGFKGEMYTCPSNGYTMTMYRIINPLADPKTLNRYPIAYFHGVLFNAANMISNSNSTRPRKPVIGDLSVLVKGAEGYDDNSLPFMMSNNNFDVWLIDARGANPKAVDADLKRLDFQSNKYWDFNLDNEALEDVPTVIDFILRQTNSEKVVYCSYSESTTFMFMLLSSYPQYSQKIAAFIGLAPVAYLTGAKGLALAFSYNLFIPDSINADVMPAPLLTLQNAALANVCSNRMTNQLVCAPLMDSIAGKGNSELNPSFFQNFFKPTSLSAFRQFLQFFIQKRFGKYDFGPQINMIKYGQPTPPDYDLSKIPSERIILVRGLADFLSTKVDQEILLTKVKPLADIVLPLYNHFDFIDGLNLVQDVNEPIMKNVYFIMKNWEPSVIRDPSSPSMFNGPYSVKPVESIEPGQAKTPNNAVLFDPGNMGLVSSIVEAPMNIMNQLSQFG